MTFNNQNTTAIFHGDVCRAALVGKSKRFLKRSWKNIQRKLDKLDTQQEKKWSTMSQLKKDELIYLRMQYWHLFCAISDILRQNGKLQNLVQSTANRGGK